jgi:hypothetical protein
VSDDAPEQSVLAHQSGKVSAAYVELLQRHLGRFWPDHRCEPLVWTLGSWAREHPEFRVLEHAPSGRAQPWIYVSAGTAHLRSVGGVGHEYVIRTRTQEKLMVELLAMVASYSVREDGGLHDGHTVPIGRSWVEGAEADHLYVNKPYFACPDFAALRIDDSFTVQFLWLVPITEREKEWRHEHGQEDFEQLLEDYEVTPEDPTRRSAV